ncbi:ribosomal protein L11 methyltransferase [Actinoplanes cyaneus]|uniref:Ribosomal protein L11 methyltransferase n=1 Tax=Actinoplanes cyaneus TaxID=52696 RepID=A0A919IDI1_9ACTN|nr:50S ribosomal protein L11 methyltransferase [Actinoplanes cyaneus]MCW2143533.1 putative nicotinamide N-methyase [Actinoplanes cyaneus]GID62381.1 ribosomal protein L11 methyltransferase [Actinoplanes cyaneus]
MPSPSGTLLARFLTSEADADGYDGLRLVRLPFVPEISLHLADDAIVLEARLEIQSGMTFHPFWTNAWAGGQAVARYVLDHPELVAGRRVLDVACGGGVAAIAAARAGAAVVTANDIDPYACAAAAMNADANAVSLRLLEGDLLGGDGGDAEVILVGDAFYDRDLAARMTVFLRRATARGATVLVGDPGRGHVPEHWLQVLRAYRITGLGAAQDAGITEVSVLGSVR